MLVMPLDELETLTGRKAPRLLPVGSLALAVGAIIALVAQQLWPVFMLGLVTAAYGIIALMTNRGSISHYRDDSYRIWVQAQAESLQEGDELG